MFCLRYCNTYLVFWSEWWHHKDIFKNNWPLVIASYQRYMRFWQFPFSFFFANNVVSNHLSLWNQFYAFTLETFQDFLIKLDTEPLMRLLEISIFSLNNDLVRLTKIMNNLVKDLKILSFKVIFQCLRLVEIFWKKLWEEYLIRRPTYINEMFWKNDFLKYLIY